MLPTSITNSVPDSSPHRAERNVNEDVVQVPQDMVRALRSDHAGETGAVYIYRGILAVSRNGSVRSFAHHHLETEQQHLELMEHLVPEQQRSRLLATWRVAGWLTGAMPALFGASAVYRTIEAVETFVDHHYTEQIKRLRHRPADQALCSLLERCRDDELLHRDDARGRLKRASLVGRVWAAMVDAGSRAGVYIAARI